MTDVVAKETPPLKIEGQGELNRRDQFFISLNLQEYSFYNSCSGSLGMD